MGKKKSSRNWMDEHVSDEYVKRAQIDGYRSRAAYKLLELQDKDHFIHPGMNIVELGSAPGGWTQVLTRMLDGRGRIIAMDILPMDSLPDVSFIQADFTEEEALKLLNEQLGGEKVDLVLSDMAPNISGIKAVDQPAMIYLLELALELCYNYLKNKGNFVAKVFQGEGFDVLLKEMRQRFETVKIRKPKSSRSRSPEMYLVAKGFKG